MINLIIVLSEKAAHALNAGSLEDPAVAELDRAVAAFGGRLQPLHRTTADAQLQKYASVKVPDRSRADSLLQELRALEVVESAYEKPTDEPA